MGTKIRRFRSKLFGNISNETRRHPILGKRRQHKIPTISSSNHPEKKEEKPPYLPPKITTKITRKESRKRTPESDTPQIEQSRSQNLTPKAPNKSTTQPLERNSPAKTCNATVESKPLLLPTETQPAKLRFVGDNNHLPQAGERADGRTCGAGAGASTSRLVRGNPSQQLPSPRPLGETNTALAFSPEALHPHRSSRFQNLCGTK